MIWFFRALALSVATLILVLSLQPFIGPVSVNHGDKLQHFLAYGLLASLVGFGWPTLRGIWVVVWVSAFGLGIEFLQGAMSQGRTASGLDALANLAGALVAVMALFFLRSLLRRRNERMR